MDPRRPSHAPLPSAPTPIGTGPSPLPRPMAFAFDLDGTLLDSRLDIAAACNHTLKARGRVPLAPETISGFVGDGARSLLARAFELPKSDPALDEILEIFVTYYAGHPVDASKFMPFADETLEALKTYPVALVTNKTRRVTLPILEALGWTNRFQFIVAGGDGPLKPDPTPIHRTAEALGVPVENLWVVGDGIQDVLAGNAAGAVTIAVLGGFHTEESLLSCKPSRLLRTLQGLLHLVDGG